MLQKQQQLLFDNEQVHFVSVNSQTPVWYSELPLHSTYERL
jgi:hypothetical protein